MISVFPNLPDVVDASDRDSVLDAYVDTTRFGDGKLIHTLTLEASQRGASLWTKKITFQVDAPFDVQDLTTVDPFLIAALFPAMGLGGTLRVHGAVSRTLIRNVLDYQSAWFLAAPAFCRPFNLEVAEIDDRPKSAPEPHPKTILAFSGGLDSMLALNRNVSGDAGPTGYNLAATMMVSGFGSEYGTGEDTSASISDLRRLSAGRNLPMAVVETDISRVIRKRQMTHGTWLVACLSLFAGQYQVGLLGSSVKWFTQGYEIYGSHPLLDPLLSGGQMSIRNDEGLYTRVEKTFALSQYNSAVDDLRVCFHPYRPERNCCRCEKCIRTMLCFVAIGAPIPSSFPMGLRLRDIGIGLGNLNGLGYVSEILDYADRNGTSDLEAMRILQRRYRTKKVKVAAKLALKRWATGSTRHRWHVLDAVGPDDRLI